MAPRDSGTTHVAFGSHDGLGLHNVVISWLNPTPHAITVYASDPASFPGAPCGDPYQLQPTLPLLAPPGQWAQKTQWSCSSVAWSI
jgi:hypothetical protein